MTATVPTAWRSRIIGSGVEAPDQLLANPRNWRVHPKAQQDALAGVLNEVGWVQQVIVNQRTGHLIDGHLRVSLALQRDEPSIPVVYVDLDEGEEALALASMDPLAAMAVTDAPKLDALLRDVSTGEAGVQAMLASLARTNGLYGEAANDPNAEWVGMPEFEQSDLMPARQVIVNFASPEAVQEFAALVGQPISQEPGKNTKFIWYPAMPRERLTHIGYESDES